MRVINPVIPYYATGAQGAVEHGQALHGAYLDNAKNIIFASLHIENILGAGIGRYFYGEEARHRKALDDLLISTSSNTFSEKRKAFVNILVEQGLLQGAERAAYEKLIAKIIRYRNMFTHGIPVFNGSSCVLQYYEGGQRTMEITGELLDQVESDLSECFRESEKLMAQIVRIT